MPVAATAVREHLDDGVNDGDGASEDGNVFSKEEILQRLEKCALDNDIMRVLLDDSLTADDKCYR